MYISRLKKQLSWPRDMFQPSSRATALTAAPEERPYPSLLFHPVPFERTAFTTQPRKRFCTVHTHDGLGEMIQSIVSTDHATLYLYMKGGVLVIALDPAERIYMVDLQRLGLTGLGVRQPFNTAQLQASSSGGPSDGGPLLLDQDRLPSLKGLLESPSIAKVMFDSRATVAALRDPWGIALRGVQDIQLMELAGRPLLPPGRPFHRKLEGRAMPRNLPAAESHQARPQGSFMVEVHLVDQVRHLPGLHRRYWARLDDVRREALKLRTERRVRDAFTMADIPESSSAVWQVIMRPGVVEGLEGHLERRNVE
ncbi:hypothetical protein M406DRAFT_68908 [Cryphonectria parasitica EP155]|uniref:3'-5' exonuclease domain-containing protein n=1 Tax=Cryphonectria parasitica (strain ATCC 38755 / EP155) TaxID=660469 RepID=A0A9P4Y4K5_CRYP1|nr:uncharacterized protein M406DRAFT_68908 [Cryphonectria parasitica EP155]KAF3766588.1 hypothetical protein M406DRAFT_68908 [Cryphonectria parasitica EP155]